MTSFDVTVADGTRLTALRSGTPGAPVVVLLHAGVADHRSWTDVVAALGDDVDVIAYDRRGYGEAPAAGAGFTHLDDLVAVLDAAGVDRAVLVGNSMGGALALDLALTRPDRVAAVLLIAGGVTGMTDEGEAITWTPDPASAAILEPLDAAEAAGDLEQQLRLQLHFWLDGPAQAEGRVGGPARELAADMERRVLRAGTRTSTGDPGLDTWHRLREITVPVLATWGAFDAACDLPFYELAAQRLPNATARVLPGVAHLPSLEQPGTVAALVRETVALAAH